MEDRTQASFVEGWKVLFQARTVFGCLLIVALLANLAVFFVARFTDLTKTKCDKVVVCPMMTDSPVKGVTSAPAEATTQAAKVTASAPAASDAAADTMPAGPIGCILGSSISMGQSSPWYHVFSNIMKLTAVVSLVSIVFLVLCALLGVMMLTAGQLPGTGLLTSCFFWAIGIVVLMLPWSTLLPDVTCLPIGISSFTEIQSALVSRCGGSQSWVANAVEAFQVWAKFVVVPVLMILITFLYLKQTKLADLGLKAHVGK